MTKNKCAMQSLNALALDKKSEMNDPFLSETLSTFYQFITSYDDIEFDNEKLLMPLRKGSRFI